MSSLTRDGEVFVLDLGDGENRFNDDSLAAVEGHLAEVEAAPAPRALVTSATGKFWSNGLGPRVAGPAGRWVGAVRRAPARAARAGARVGVPCVAALQGHTFAGGAMLALAHDERVMRADRGYFCLPEVDIKIPFTPGMSALIARACRAARRTRR